MKLKSTAYYWLVVIFGGVGMGTAMGAEVLQVALLRIYDVEQEPPALVSQQQFPVTSVAIVIADELAKRKPERLYRVFDADMNIVYAR